MWFRATEFVICSSGHRKPLRQVCQRTEGGGAHSTPRGPRLSSLLAGGCNVSIPSRTVLNTTVCMCAVYLHTCASTCTQKEAAPRERTGAKLCPDHRARLLGWMGVAGTALCALFAPCFSFKSLQGNAIIRNTKGRKCRRSTTHPRGSVKDKTSKWSREKGEPRESKRSKRKSRRVPETRLCALTDLVPWDWSKSQGCSLAPLKTA